MDRIEEVQRVLPLLYEVAVKLKLKKSKFYAETIYYMGYVIRPNCLELAKGRTETVRKFKNPTMQMEGAPFSTHAPSSNL